ncbi:hypothetical protein E2562_003641 [Oryza meyeriana var. granulata]|uniref:Secreted protein n=1 Tax=Oryza meyeriana var. granulata TaxID=110450 RepID=A0A6G1C3N0_9ORYZ|nr:hypothetical protein E2562_003641 [Oryza meyeriana var. granulata]
MKWQRFLHWTLDIGLLGVAVAGGDDLGDQLPLQVSVMGSEDRERDVESEDNRDAPALLSMAVYLAVDDPVDVEGDAKGWPCQCHPEVGQAVGEIRRVVVALLLQRGIEPLPIRCERGFSTSQQRLKKRG